MALHRNFTVRPGDVVLDIGCLLTQERRRAGLEPDPARVIVVRAFSWGFWVVPEGAEDDTGALDHDQIYCVEYWVEPSALGDQTKKESAT